jgi:hypothetical protein
MFSAELSLINYRPRLTFKNTPENSFLPKKGTIDKIKISKEKFAGNMRQVFSQFS